MELTAYSVRSCLAPAFSRSSGLALGPKEGTEMGNLADRLRKDLEARGEYVVRANASTGWFAVFPITWRRRTEGAMRDGREGPNLVVCKTHAYSARRLPLIPVELCHRFRPKVATDSD